MLPRWFCSRALNSWAGLNAPPRIAPLTGSTMSRSASRLRTGTVPSVESESVATGAPARLVRRLPAEPEHFRSLTALLVQYVSIRYSERLAEAGIEPSVGSTGDSYDNALAETINGLYKAEIIHRRGPWKTREAVELATLEWVSWFNNHRLLEPIGYIPPAEAEANYWRQQAQASSTTKPAREAALQEG